MLGSTQTLTRQQSENDVQFLMRIALQASLPSVPTDLRSDAETLMNTLASNIPSFSREAYEKQAIEETCPACGLVVRLENGSDGSCPSGHTWGKPFSQLFSSTKGSNRRGLRSLFGDHLHLVDAQRKNMCGLYSQDLPTLVEPQFCFCSKLAPAIRSELAG